MYLVQSYSGFGEGGLTLWCLGFLLCVVFFFVFFVLYFYFVLNISSTVDLDYSLI